MSKYIEEYENKVVLVTGGAGCIGSNLTKALIDTGAKKIIILDDLSSAVEWNIPSSPNVHFIQGSVLDNKVLDEVFSVNIDFIFHLAAHFANQNSVDHPEEDLMVNGLGTLKVLEYSRHKNIKRFVYSSSGCGVYGLDSTVPFKEHDISISLHTPYQVTKLLGELYTNYFYNLYNLPIVNARFFNVYGPGEIPGRYRNVIPNFFYWAISGKPLPITGTGNETRDWTFVDDIVSGLLAMGIAKEAIGQAINLGSGSEHTVIEMATRINDMTDNKAGITYLGRREWDTKHRLLSSIEKAQRLLNYQPGMEFNTGLREVYTWFQSNWINIQKDAKF
jgi:nucleoside-diphosphate-sugar epimerase